MSNSTVSNIWIEHMKVGAWMDGPFTNLVFTGMRIRNVTADGAVLYVRDPLNMIVVNQRVGGGGTSSANADAAHNVAKSARRRDEG